MSITFTVTDTDCEAAPPNLTPPNVSIAAVSTTRVATVKGYNEFQEFAHVPPKRYHTASWSGSSEHQLFVGASQIGGAKYDYSGFDHVDSGGNIDNTHTKELSVMCNGDLTGKYSMIQGNRTNGTSESYWFSGYYGMDISDPAFGPNNPGDFSPMTILCGAPSLPYMDIGDKAINGETDSSNLWGSVLIKGTANLGISKYVATSDTNKEGVETGTSAVLVTPYLPRFGLDFGGGASPVPPDYFTPATINYIHNYACVLSDEYTDAEALAHAVVSTGNSTTAQNLPRTTGYISTFTTVAFALVCTNLVAGQNYLINVEFFDQTSGARTTKSYGVTATGSTSTVHDVVPTPAAGKTLQVRRPHIALVPHTH